METEITGYYRNCTRPMFMGVLMIKVGYSIDDFCRNKYGGCLPETADWNVEYVREGSRNNTQGR